MKPKIFVSILFGFLVALAIYAASKNSAFQPAGDFPRGALVYVQIADLPAFLKLWNESNFKEKYLNSENFRQFKNSHLGLKLASRGTEFSEASGFPIDSSALESIVENRAAVALYDIGKLEFVFIAPVQEEFFAAAKFTLNRDKFEQQTLEDGTEVYRAKVEADRGRQKQELIFANVKGRFVLATSEKLLAQTLNNINGGVLKNRLAEEPEFKSLANKIEPHIATVWVNQTALNEDYYFKRYWLISGAETLKNIRAGIFDFSVEEGKIVEHRKFLLKEKVNLMPINQERAAEMLSLLPEDIPFYRLQKAELKLVGSAVENTLFDRQEQEQKAEKKPETYASSFDSYRFSDYSGYRNYNYLSEDFDKPIDEIEESDEKTVERRDAEINFSRFFQAANPQSVLTLTKPEVTQPAPLFTEFSRAAIFDLSAPAAFRREEFEAAAAKKFAAAMTVFAPGTSFNWETKIENGFEWRELQLPVTGFTANYLVRGNKLILTNDSELLLKILSNQNAQSATSTTELTELTVLNLSETENAYTKIFAELERRNAADDFFTGNVAGLLASISDIKKIEIRRGYSSEFSDETVTAFR